MMNPAVDWRGSRARCSTRAMKLADRHHDSTGGSALATQIEKFPPLARGADASIPDKFRQMASASLRAYVNGPDTQRARENASCSTT